MIGTIVMELYKKKKDRTELKKKKYQEIGKLSRKFVLKETES